MNAILMLFALALLGRKRGAGQWPAPAPAAAPAAAAPPAAEPAAAAPPAAAPAAAAPVEAPASQAAAPAVAPAGEVSALPAGVKFYAPTPEPVVERAKALLRAWKANRIWQEPDPSGKYPLIWYRAERHAKNKKGITVYRPADAAVSGDAIDTV